MAGTQSPGATPVAVLAGFNSDGSPDTSFSGDGKATLPLAANDVVSSVDVSATGRIAVGVIAGNGNFKVIVFTAAGAPDGGFGAGGVATSDVGATDQTTAVGFQSTGKLIAAGGTTKNTGDFAIVRFGVNGAIDNAGRRRSGDRASAPALRDGRRSTHPTEARTGCWGWRSTPPTGSCSAGRRALNVGYGCPTAAP